MRLNTIHNKSDKMILIYIPCRDRKEAGSIAEQLLEKKLIACANMLPVESIYKWKGEVQQEKEAVLLCKTRDGYYSDITREVKKLHSYDVPAVIKLKADSNKSFGDWLYSETFR